MSYKCGTVFLKPEWMLLLEMQPLQERLSDGVGSQEKTKIDWEEPKYYGQRSICLKER